MGNPATGAAAGFEQMAADATNEVEEAGIIAAFTGLGMLLGERGGAAAGVAICAASGVGAPAVVVCGTVGSWVGGGIGFGVGYGGATIFNNYMNGDYAKYGMGSRDMPLSLTGHSVASNGSSTWNYSTIENMKVSYTANSSGSVTSMSATGTNADNYMAGNSAANTIIGNGGRDQLIGLGGRDDLQGNLGIDTLTGGNGHDTFRFAGGNDRLNRDLVTDAESGVDRFMNLHRIIDIETEMAGSLKIVTEVWDSVGNHIIFHRSEGAAVSIAPADDLAEINAFAARVWEVDHLLAA